MGAGNKQCHGTLRACPASVSTSGSAHCEGGSWTPGRTRFQHLPHLCFPACGWHGPGLGPPGSAEGFTPYGRGRVGTRPASFPSQKF